MTPTEAEAQLRSSLLLAYANVEQHLLAAGHSPAEARQAVAVVESVVDASMPGFISCFEHGWKQGVSDAAELCEGAVQVSRHRDGGTVLEVMAEQLREMSAAGLLESA